MKSVKIFGIPRRLAGWFSFGTATSILVSLVFVSAGCSPPPPEVADVSLSIGSPDADPGQLTGAPIAPPDLPDLNRRNQTEARSVAMQLGDGSKLIQRTGGVPTRSVELVPTPQPDNGVPVPDNGVPGNKGPEVVPTPAGVPVSKMAAGEAEKPPAGVPADDLGGLGPENYREWEQPRLALVVTGNQHGYIEPCGCTGLDRQKGGVARRYTFVQELRDKGWPLIPIDGGNQVRRYGRQAEIKLGQTARALKAMDYQAVGFGPDDLRLGVGELLAVAASDDPEKSLYVSANVILIDSSLMPQSKVVERNGIRVGLTSILDPAALEVATSDEIVVEPPDQAATKAIEQWKSGRVDFRVLLFFGEEEAAQQLVRDVPGFDLLVVAGGYGEPTYRAEPIKDSETRMIVTGNKGMYAGLVGLYGPGDFKYARVPLTHEFADAPEMRQLMKEYQDQLRDVGLQGLGLLPPIPHSSGHEFVGTAKCGECHTTAYEIWQGTMHAEATDHIVKPPKERGDIARHFDPECISCHVTGWNPQEYYPYKSGYLSLEAHQHLTGNGCENCHGPGSAHTSAEEDGSTVTEELRQQLHNQMKLPLESAREHCMKCHDLDNSPDFHEEDAFEDVYWPEVEHEGKD